MKTPHIALRRLGLIAAAGVLATPSQAAFDAFLRFNGPQNGAIEARGESNDANFNSRDRWIELRSFGAGILNSITLGPTDPPTGKASFREFTFQKSVDSASPSLFKANAVGGYYNTADLVLRQAGATVPTAPFYSVTLHTVFKIGRAHV